MSRLPRLLAHTGQLLGGTADKLFAMAVVWAFFAVGLALSPMTWVYLLILRSLDVVLVLMAMLVGLQPHLYSPQLYSGSYANVAAS